MKMLSFKLSLALSGVMQVQESEWRAAVAEMKDALKELEETGSVKEFGEQGVHIASNILEEFPGDHDAAAEAFLLRAVTAGMRKDLLKEFPRDYPEARKLQVSVSMVPKSDTIMKAPEEVSE